MTAPVTPDVEAILIEILRPLGVDVATQVPNPRPKELIRISLIGGSGAGLLDNPNLLVECWSPSTPGASRLARDARYLIREARFDVVGGWQIYGVRADVPTSYPDETSQRYQFVASLGVRKS